jgi:hypothetical protein
LTATGSSLNVNITGGGSGGTQYTDGTAESAGAFIAHSLKVICLSSGDPKNADRATTITVIITSAAVPSLRMS